MTRAARPALRLRGHHLLCLFGFRGFGYSRPFVSNMAGVARAFFSPRGPRVVLVEGPDDICGACPHLFARDCRCADVPSLEERDARTLRRLGLRRGGRKGSAALRELVRDRITPEVLAELCSGCGWLASGVCGKGFSPRTGAWRRAAARAS